MLTDRNSSCFRMLSWLRDVTHTTRQASRTSFSPISSRTRRIYLQAYQMQIFSVKSHSHVGQRVVLGDACGSAHLDGLVHDPAGSPRSGHFDHCNLCSKIQKGGTFVRRHAACWVHACSALCEGTRNPHHTCVTPGQDHWWELTGTGRQAASHSSSQKVYSIFYHKVRLYSCIYDLFPERAN